MSLRRLLARRRRRLGVDFGSQRSSMNHGASFRMSRNISSNRDSSARKDGLRLHPKCIASNRINMLASQACCRSYSLRATSRPFSSEVSLVKEQDALLQEGYVEMEAKRSKDQDQTNEPSDSLLQFIRKHAPFSSAHSPDVEALLRDASETIINHDVAAFYASQLDLYFGEMTGSESPGSKLMACLRASSVSEDDVADDNDDCAVDAAAYAKKHIEHLRGALLRDAKSFDREYAFDEGRLFFQFISSSESQVVDEIRDLVLRFWDYRLPRSIRAEMLDERLWSTQPPLTKEAFQYSVIDTLANYGASDDIIDSALDVIFALPPANPFWRMRTLGASRASFDYKALAPQRIDIAYDPDEVVYECVESDEVLSRMEQTAFIEGIPSIEVMRVGALPQDGESVLESAVATCLEDIYDIEGVTFRVCKSTAPPRQLRRRIERGKVSDRLLPEIAGSMGIDHAASIEALASSPHAVNCRVAHEIMELYSDKSSAFEKKRITLKKELDDEAGALLQKLSSPPSGDAGSAASWKNSQHDIFYRLILGPFYASNGDMSRDEVEMLTFADVVEK